LSLDIALVPADSHFGPLIIPPEHRYRDPPLVKHILCEHLFSHLRLTKHSFLDCVSHARVQVLDYELLLLFLQFFVLHMLPKVFQNVLHFNHFLFCDERGHKSALLELAAPKVENSRLQGEI
jgi:hypothetical protein